MFTRLLEQPSDQGHGYNPGEVTASLELSLCDSVQFWGLGDCARQAYYRCDETP